MTTEEKDYRYMTDQREAFLALAVEIAAYSGVIRCGIADDLARYIIYRTEVGGYLKAIITDDLTGLIRRADDYALDSGEWRMIHRFLYNRVPLVCRGAEPKYHDWTRKITKCQFGFGDESKRPPQRAPEFEDSRVAQMMGEAHGPDNEPS